MSTKASIVYGEDPHPKNFGRRERDWIHIYSDLAECDRLAIYVEGYCSRFGPFEFKLTPKQCREFGVDFCEACEFEEPYRTDDLPHPVHRSVHTCEYGNEPGNTTRPK